ncbi:MAG: cell wall metabolism sensor histidine kinase WalK [Clostridia bacterium]|nr:cell wall metabolism sensor histidine kinase WalK [Clostridia bacterium]
MFHQLRNRFLVLHLAITTITMFLAFGAICLIIFKYNDIGIRQELHQLSSSIRIIDVNDPSYLIHSFPDYPEVDHITNSGLIISLEQNLNSREHTISFFVLLDAQNNVLDRRSNYYGIHDKLYEEAVQFFLKQENNYGRFRSGGFAWAYSKKPVAPGYFCLTVMNITAQEIVLRYLLYSSLLVSVGVLIIIYFISRYFADRYIRPVKLAFDKQKQFVSDASHELKTPLTSINANIDVVLSNPESSVAEQSKWLQYIQSETKRMTRLTNDLLYLSRMNNQDLQAAFVPIDLSDLTANTIMIMEAVIFEKGFSFESKIVPDLWINGNQEQISQLILILLDNAVKYTNPKGKILVTLESKDNLVVLKIQNTGEGISQEHLNHIFDRFYRPDTSRERKTGGYGLGLAIAKAITETHGGHIQAFSQEQKFTVFRITWKKLKHYSED